ncbi:leucyl aminopeptidase [Buchnera aphidicola]|uniref:leucyl aminopeptidase n=1 Tax=Buchnera aphidicola TaxID=9 RepID=UPI0020938E4C|nr:leucyl aminopeptidase [Buchnera aphidicola]USS94365.1 leucyl aminopeptidase [Buchnera aphidicola (Sipha maydis)]
MEIIQYEKTYKILKNNCIVFGIYEDENYFSIFHKINKYITYDIKNILKINDWKKNFGKIILLYTDLKSKYNRVILINCGNKNKFCRNSFFSIIKKIFILCQENSIEYIYINISDFQYYKKNIYWKIRNIIDSYTEVFYLFNKYKTEIKKYIFVKKIFIKINIKKHLLDFKKAVFHGLSISKGIKLTKDISNTPSNICTPKYLVKKSYKIFKKYKKNVEVKIFNQEDIKKLGMNAFLTVARGSSQKAYMSIMYYKNKDAINHRPFVLIGKGVTFDSGGISIKSSYLMDEMKYDMCGAASVIGIMKFLAELNLPLNVIGIIGTCENMINGNSYKPGDIISTMSKKTIEILNTDAEGRLILCDILTYVERFNPKIVIDIATLTGSCVATLGNAASGLFSNNKNLAKKIKKASKNINDKVWNLPKFKVYKKYLQSNVADLSNIGEKYAGASTASYFLSYFAKKYKWLHLDIAGTAWNSGKKKSATGKPVTLICQYFLNILKKYKKL